MNRSKLKPGPFGARTAPKMRDRKITLSNANEFSLDQIIQFDAAISERQAGEAK